MTEANGRVALVTGGGRGIGKAIALGLAADGVDLAVNYRRDEDAARETVAEIEQLGRRAVAYAAPVDDAAACEEMVERVLADFGAVDILVNNAGIASRGQTVADTDPRRGRARVAHARVRVVAVLQAGAALDAHACGAATS